MKNILLFVAIVSLSLACSKGHTDTLPVEEVPLSSEMLETATVDLSGNLLKPLRNVDIEEIGQRLPTMVVIAGGKFMMGTDDIEHDAEKRAFPAHLVSLSPFIMAKTLVTQGLWNLFIEDTGYTGYPFSHEYYGDLLKNSQGDDSPAIFLTWCEAIVFCNWLSIRQGLEAAYIIEGALDPELRGGIQAAWKRGVNGYRLITEAEWEYVIYEKDAKREDLYKLYEDAFNTKQQRKVPSVFTGQRTSSGVLAYPNFGISEWTWDEFMVYGLEPLVDPTGQSGLSSEGNTKVNRYFVDKILFNRLTTHKENSPGEFICIRLAQDTL